MNLKAGESGMFAAAISPELGMLIRDAKARGTFDCWHTEIRHVEGNKFERECHFIVDNTIVASMRISFECKIPWYRWAAWRFFRKPLPLGDPRVSTDSFITGPE